MIISTGNSVRGNTFTSTAIISSGSAENVRDPDFSKNLVTSSSDFYIQCGASSNSRYVAIHGLSLPIGTIVTVSDLTIVKSTFTTTRETSSLVFYTDIPHFFGFLRVRFEGPGQKIISYIQAGDAANINWGVNAGKSLTYFANNQRNRSVVNQRGLPTSFLTEKISPKLSLIIKNELKTFSRGDLQDIFTHYNLDGVISILDYEDDALPDESCAAFELSNDSVNAHSQTEVLADVKLNFRVA